MTENANCGAFGTETFEAEFVQLKNLISDNSKKLPEVELWLTKFVIENVRNSTSYFNRKIYRKAFIRYKHLEDLLFIMLRA